jgi:hypothetical protein
MGRRSRRGDNGEWRDRVFRGALPPDRLRGRVSGTVVLAEDVDGFGLGMSMAKARQLAIEKGYTFSNPIKSSVDRWVSYLLMKGTR